MFVVGTDGAVKRTYGGEANALGKWFPMNAISYLADN